MVGAHAAGMALGRDFKVDCLVLFHVCIVCMWDSTPKPLQQQARAQRNLSALNWGTQWRCAPSPCSGGFRLVLAQAVSPHGRGMVHW